MKLCSYAKLRFVFSPRRATPSLITNQAFRCATPQVRSMRQSISPHRDQIAEITAAYATSTLPQLAFRMSFHRCHVLFFHLTAGKRGVLKLCMASTGLRIC